MQETYKKKLYSKYIWATIQEVYLAIYDILMDGRNRNTKLSVGAFSDRIGLPPAVTGWAVSCDGGP